MVTLSTIVVNVKGKDNLPKLLESLKRSSYNDFELIAVDNEQISGPFKLIKIEKDLRLAYCRNFALMLQESICCFWITIQSFCQIQHLKL